VVAEHGVQVVDAAQVVAQLGGAHLHDESRRVRCLVAPRLEFGLAWWGGEHPGIVLRSRPFDVVAHGSLLQSLFETDHARQYLPSVVMIIDNVSDVCEPAVLSSCCASSNPGAG
jgi:hypothetical protein